MEINKPQDYSLKNMRKSLKEKGQFYTSEKLAQTLKSYLPEIDDNTQSVFDPTCGHGALLATFDDSVSKYGVDIDHSAVDWANKNIKNFFGRHCDYLEYAPMGKFSRIIANPPFSVSWQHEHSALAPVIMSKVGKLPPKTKADWAFLFKIVEDLMPNGTAVVLNFPGILYRQNEAIFREYFIERNLIDRIVAVPSGHFEDTKISTVILVLKKNRTSNKVIFEDLEHGITREVEYDEIAENNYLLSVNNYISPPEKEAENIDPIDLEKRARLAMWHKLEADMKMSKIICELEGWDFEKYRQFLLERIKKF